MPVILSYLPDVALHPEDESKDEQTGGYDYFVDYWQIMPYPFLLQ